MFVSFSVVSVNLGGLVVGDLFMRVFSWIKEFFGGSLVAGFGFLVEKADSRFEFQKRSFCVNVYFKNLSNIIFV